MRFEDNFEIPVRSPEHPMAAFFKSRYGISVEFPDGSEEYHPKIFHSLAPATDDEIRFAYLTLGVELPKYHPTYLKMLGLDSIQVTGSIEMVEKKRRSVWPPKPQRIGGYAQPYPRRLYMVTEGMSMEQIAIILHHELQHLGEYLKFRKKSKKATKLSRLRDPRWIDLNPTGKRAYKHYDMDEYYRKLRTAKTTPGFVRPYGQIDDIEDRATCAEVVFRRPEIRNQILQNDDVIAAKVEEVKRQLRIRSHGKMNEAWFRLPMIQMY